ncbi:MAG: hypothetical protein GY811_28210, partial [Myxococcales bacterium]|nr:hypothetical protein [Myxococcales bacterium]
MTFFSSLLSSLFLLSFATNAWADPSASGESSLALDYDAKPKGCPDADRFADEVSSKLGFVPWNDAASDKLRVRITEDSGEIVATLELPDGGSKVLRDSTCRRLLSSLAAATAVALDSGGSAPSQPQASLGSSTATDQSKARVHVRTTKPGVIVSTITDRVAMVGSNGASAVRPSRGLRRACSRGGAMSLAATLAVIGELGKELKMSSLLANLESLT